MRKSILAVRLLLLGAVLPLGACHPKPPPVREEYTGALVALPQIVERINANNARVPTLYAVHRFGAHITDDRGQAHDGFGDGALLYRRPDELHMTGSHELGADIFDLGRNGEAYWLAVPLPAVNTMWHGRIDRLDGAAAGRLPVRPDLIAEVLALSPIDTNLQRFPAPVLRFEGQQDAYVLTWVHPGPGHLVAGKEIAYDRLTLHPRRVRLYDDTGRVILRAELFDHRPVEVPGLPESQWPAVARKYDLYFPLTRSTMSFQFDDVSLAYRGRPDDANFRMPERPDGAREINLDEPHHP